MERRTIKEIKEIKEKEMERERTHPTCCRYVNDIEVTKNHLREVDGIQAGLGLSIIELS